MKINREDVVQAALIVERWCKGNFWSAGRCDCPFNGENDGYGCFLSDRYEPGHWNLEKYLRTRGLKHETE